MDMDYKEAIANAEHLIALGHRRVWIKQDGAPWDKVVTVEASGGYRFNGPCGVRMIAREAGLELHWTVDFEPRDANGKPASLFDRDRLREVMRKLRPVARAEFANFLETAVLPDVQKRTREIRETLNFQMDSEDCVRGLIAFAADERVG